jgi:hypothetical protein
MGSHILHKIRDIREDGENVGTVCEVLFILFETDRWLFSGLNRISVWLLR